MQETRLEYAQTNQFSKRFHSPAERRRPYLPMRSRAGERRKTYRMDRKPFVFNLYAIPLRSRVRNQVRHFFRQRCRGRVAGLRHTWPTIDLQRGILAAYSHSIKRIPSHSPSGRFLKGTTTPG